MSYRIDERPALATGDAWKAWVRYLAAPGLRWERVAEAASGSRSDASHRDPREEETMSFTRRLLLGMAVATSMTLPALAEDYAHDPAAIMLVFPGGKVMSVPLAGKAMKDMVMAHAKEVTGPLMIVTSGGKTYIVEDMKMSDGRMLSDYLADPAYRGGA
jgi:hypothetical protein